ncbi:MAG: hypothetical protein EZS28_047920, partial [Streblomastix strix]
MIIESEDSNNQTAKNLTMKPNINKIVQVINQERQDHLIQPIPNKKQETQTLHNPKSNLLQSLNPQNQTKQKEKLQYLNRRYDNLTSTILEAEQVNQSPYLISPQGVPNLEPTPTLLTTSHNSRSGEKRQMQPQLLKTSPQNAPKATRPVQDPRNGNKESTQTTKQKQSPIPRPTSRISWTEEERDQEKGEGRDLENRETDKENREILDRNGRINNEIFGITGNNQYEKLYPIRIYPPVERQLECQRTKMLVKDNEIQWNRRRSKRIQNIVGRGIERDHCNTDQKGINQMVQPDIHDKESKREMEKDTGCESFEQTDSRLPLQDARFDQGKTNNQTWELGHFTGPHLRISLSNCPSRITTIPSIRVPKQPLHIQSNAIWNQTLTNILYYSNGTDNETNKNET